MRKLLLFLLLPLISAAQCVKPTITSGPTVTWSGTSATFTWTTDVASDTMAFIAFDTGTPDQFDWPLHVGQWWNTSGAIDLTGVTSHSYTITGLMPGHSYNYNVRSRCVSGGAPVLDQAHLTFAFTNPWSPVTTSPGIVTTNPSDFYIETQGGHAIYNMTTGMPSGSGMAIKISGWLLAGSDTTVATTITGIPACMSYGWIGYQDHAPSGASITYNWNNFWHGANLHLSANACTPGAYTLTATLVSNPSGVSHSATYVVNVSNLTPLTVTPPAVFPTIPCGHAGSTMIGGGACANTYDSNIQTAGAKWAGSLIMGCANNTYAGGDAWAEFYDGGRVYFQAYDYAQKYGLSANPLSLYDTAALNCNNYYLTNYAAPNTYNLPLFRTFTEGAFLNWTRHQNAYAWNALVGFDAHSSLMIYPYDHIDNAAAREASYTLGLMRIYQKATRIAQNTGNPVGITEKNYGSSMVNMVDILLGILDQDINSTTTQTGTLEQWTYDSLVMDELQRYYTDAQDGAADPRIPVVIKATLDHLIDPAQHRWAPTTGDPNGFCLNCRAADLGLPQNDYSNLNLGAGQGNFWWMWSLTNDSTYQTWGDKVFQYGAIYDYGSFSGKEFSWAMRASPNYFQYREATPSTNHGHQVSVFGPHL